MNIKQTIKLAVISLLSLTLLGGCFLFPPTVQELCEANSALRCTELNMNDGQCKKDRHILIQQRLVALNDSSDINKLNLLKVTKTYEQCITLAAQIEVKTLKYIKTRRAIALININKEIASLEQGLSQSQDPNIIYYQWSQGDNYALTKLRKLEGSGKLQTSELQLALSTYYMKRDPDKTLSLLHQSLKLSKPEQDISSQIQTLATINHKHGSKQHAYLWAQVGKSFDLPVVSDIQLNRLYSLDQNQVEQLKSAAEKITDALKSGKFNENLLPAVVRANCQHEEVS
ncbi:MAG: DUF2989 domain-containing protein [Aliivibrio sp.]|uniref:DUF2989 domain-containing protein n=1 Tax=Aliivibrio sp. TaxID=1872443 RepID=UPI001A5D1978|nr:DUF2989 domain-containing protein [Aliivibrio sp.]